MARNPASANQDQLQHCVNGLIGLLALQGSWANRDRLGIVDSLLDSLLALLELDLVCLSLRKPLRERPARSFWTRGRQTSSALVEDLEARLAAWMVEPLSNLPDRLGVDSGRLMIVAMPVGINGELGVVEAASSRGDFPQAAERLVLGVVANQATIVLQDAYASAHEQHDARSQFRSVIDSIAAPVTLCTPNGEVEAVNRFGLEYHRKSA